MRRGSFAYFGGARSWSATGLVEKLIRSDFALPKIFADQNDENECDVTEVSNSELWEAVITAGDGYYRQTCCSHITTEYA